MTGAPVLIAGPTASGKSALALALAQRLGGAIINCDSMQIYEGLHVVTARPTDEDEHQAPHLLYGVLPPSERCSAGRYARLAADALQTCVRRGWRPIFVGGTGLYFRALTEGLSPMPSVPLDIRMRLTAEINERGPEALHEDLAARDPDTAATVRPSDAQRVQRALEVWEATGKGLATWHAMPKQPVLQGTWQGLVLEPPRDWLYSRCDQRFDGMLDGGAVEEVERLMAQGLDSALPAMKAIGVREIAAWQDGSLTHDEARAEAQKLTRRYAKRQMTWMRNQMGDWPRLDPSAEGSAMALAAAALKGLA